MNFDYDLIYHVIDTEIYNLINMTNISIRCWRNDGVNIWDSENKTVIAVTLN
jgi:hypothetical protein